MCKIINVPIEDLKSRKGNKKRFECMACALIIKAVYQNSVFFLGVTHVMEIMGVSYKKAQKLIEWMKDDELFIFNAKKNCVFAKSLKGKVWFRYGRKRLKKYNAIADTCEKIRISDGYTLRKVTCELRNKLLINAIRNHEHDNLLVGDNIDVTKQNVKLAMPLRKLARSFGMSKSSAGRYVGMLVDDKRVSKSEIVAECVIKDLNDKSERDWYAAHPKQKFKAWHNTRSGGWSGWCMYGCVYSVLKREDIESCKHVIWNHTDRISISDSASTIDEPDGEGFFSKHYRNQSKKRHIDISGRTRYELC